MQKVVSIKVDFNVFSDVNFIEHDALNLLLADGFVITNSYQPINGLITFVLSKDEAPKTVSKSQLGIH